jgi:hypothetical protein
MLFHAHEIIPSPWQGEGEGVERRIVLRDSILILAFQEFQEEGMEKSIQFQISFIG